MSVRWKLHCVVTITSCGVEVNRVGPALAASTMNGIMKQHKHAQTLFQTKVWCIGRYKGICYQMFEQFLYLYVSVMKFIDLLYMKMCQFFMSFKTKAIKSHTVTTTTYDNYSAVSPRVHLTNTQNTNCH